MHTSHHDRGEPHVDDQEHITAQEYAQILRAAMVQHEAIQRLRDAQTATDIMGPNMLVELGHRVPEEWLQGDH